YSVAFCYGKGIIQGVDKAGNFNPKATLTRAQTAAIYVRLKNALNGTAPVETPAVPETPVEVPVETPVETPVAADNRDLNEWGIPHFRMLEGENVQQMMDRINAVTPPYKEGYLTNGKPITDENIKEMIDAVVEDMPAGSEWNNTDNKYWYNNAAVWKRGSNGCNSYAYCVSDYIFGEDAPINIHKDFSSLKVGDAMWSRNGSTKDHWVVIKEVNFDAETPYEYSISGNVNGKVSDAGGDLLTPLLDNNNPFAQYSTIWSRY
ncbi:MAG: S-layer homology domain-containing protein, partial [Oscillospiraceae bacterium]|nr:S-layer homology domain-containing protein [Oscillospiraceae bacterium]